MVDDSLPEGWELSELGRVCTIPERQIPPNELSKFEYYVGLDQIESNSGRIVDYKKTRDVGLKSSKFAFDSSCVLYGKLRPYLNKVAIPEVAGICSTDILPLHPVSKTVSKEYLYFYLRSPTFVETATEKSTGANLPRIARESLLRIKIPLPPISTQRKIAEILVRLDQLLRRRQQANQLSGKLIESFFLTSFGDPLANPKGWTTKRIGEISHVVRGSSPRPKGDRRYFGGLVPRLMIADITRDGSPVYPRIDSLTQEGARRSRHVRKGTVVIAVSGNVGLTSILGVDCCIHDGFVALLDLDKTMNSVFLRTYLELTKQVHLARSSGAIWKNLTTHEIKEITVFAPKIELQNQFAKTVDSIAKTISNQRNSDDGIKELFQSVVHRAFRGELHTGESISEATPA